MNLRQSKALASSCLIILMVMLSFSAVIPRSNAQNEVLFWIEPQAQAVPEGETFNITVHVDNIPSDPGALGFEVMLLFNQTVLTGISMTDMLYHSVVPESESDNIWQLKNIVNNTGGYVYYAYTFYDAKRAIEGGYAPISGNHTLAIITFNATLGGLATFTFATIKVGGPPVDNPTKLPAMWIGGAVLVGNPVPEITIISPRNTTYGATSLNLSVAFNKPVEWVGYSLDETPAVTATPNITAANGQHTLVVYANDSSGQMGSSAKLYFTVDTSILTAAFTYNPTTPQAEFVFEAYRWTILFNSSTSPDQRSAIAAFFWDFGDGENASSPIVDHIYRRSGAFVVTLTITDEGGNTGTQTKTLTLNQPLSESLSIPWMLIVAIVIPIVWIALLLLYVTRSRRRKRKA